MAVNKLKGLTIEIGGDTTELSKALKEPNKDISELNSKLKSINTALKFDPTSTDLLSQKQKLLGEAIKENENKLKLLKKAQEDFIKNGGDVDSAEYIELEKQIALTENKLKSLKKEQESFNVSLEKLNAYGDKIGEFGEKATEAGKKLSKASVVVAGLGTAAVKTASDFDTSMSKVQALSGATGDDLQKLEDIAREMGATTKYSASESADALSYMALAGWDVNEMVSGLPAVLNLAAASDMDLAEASDIVTDYLSAFGLTANDASKFVDQMAYAMSSSNTSTAQLGEAYKNCAATATQLGYSLEDTTAALMVMADSGIKGGEAGTGLASIMTRLGNNTSKCRDELEKYGIEVYDSQGNVNSLSSILSGMQDVWSGLTDEQKANLSYVVAGKTAQSQLMTVLGESTGSFEDYKNGLISCDGAAQDMADTMQDNLQGDLTKLKSSAEELGITIGEILMPVIRTITQKIQEFTVWLSNLDPALQTIIVVVLAVVAAVGPLLIMIGKMATGVRAVISIVTKIAPLFAGISGPVLAVVAAVTAVVAILAVLYNKCEWFRDGINAIVNGIVDFVKNSIDSIVEFFTVTIPETFNSFVEIVQVICDSVVQFFQNCWNSIISFFTETIPSWIASVIEWFGQLPYNIGFMIGQIIGFILQLGINFVNFITVDIPNFVNSIIEWFAQLPGRIWEWLTNAFNNVVQWGNDIYTSVCNYVSSMIDSVVNFFSQLPSKIWTWLTNTVNKIVSWGSNLVEKGKEVAKKLVDTVVDGVKSLPDKMASIGSNLIKGLWNGINSVKNWIMGKIKGFTNGIVDGIKSFFGIHSPSKVMEEQVGKFLPAGIGKGVDKNSNLALSPFKQLEKEMTTSFNPTLNAEVNKSLEASNSFYFEIPITATLDGDVAYKNVVRKVTNNQAARMIFKGA